MRAESSVRRAELTVLPACRPESFENQHSVGGMMMVEQNLQSFGMP